MLQKPAGCNTHKDITISLYIQPRRIARLPFEEYNQRIVSVVTERSRAVGRQPDTRQAGLFLNPCPGGAWFAFDRGQQRLGIKKQTVQHARVEYGPISRSSNVGSLRVGIANDADDLVDPVRNLYADEDTNDDNGEIYAYGEPVLFLYVPGDSTQEQGLLDRLRAPDHVVGK